MKTKQIKKVVRGRLLERVPHGENEELLWRVMGYDLLPTGDWYEPEGPIGPSLEFMKRYPHGHVCKACRTPFRSTRYHDAYCASCRGILELERKKLHDLISSFDEANHDSFQRCLRAVWDALQCPRCYWSGNAGRLEPKTFTTLKSVVEDWVEASHLHWMRHNFWNRFDTKPKFITAKDWAEKKAEDRLFDALQLYGKRNPNIIEITCSDMGIPISAEQKVSKYKLQFPPRR
jgi:hypothetical protein